MLSIRAVLVSRLHTSGTDFVEGHKGEGFNLDKTGMTIEWLQKEIGRMLQINMDAPDLKDLARKYSQVTKGRKDDDDSSDDDEEPPTKKVKTGEDGTKPEAAAA